jgi:hypothetical protein
MNKKKIQQLIVNIEGLLESLKLEIEDTEQFPEIKVVQSSSMDENIVYAEEDDGGPDILINGREEREFYERFNLGD